MPVTSKRVSAPLAWKETNSKHKLRCATRSAKLYFPWMPSTSWHFAWKIEHFAWPFFWKLRLFSWPLILGFPRNAMMNSQVFLEGFTGESFLGLFPEALHQLEAGQPQDLDKLVSIFDVGCLKSWNVLTCLEPYFIYLHLISIVPLFQHVPTCSNAKLQLEVPSLVFHHGFEDDRLHALEDAQRVAGDLHAELLVEPEPQLQWWQQCFISMKTIEIKHSEELKNLRKSKFYCAVSRTNFTFWNVGLSVEARIFQLYILTWQPSCGSYPSEICRIFDGWFRMRSGLLQD